MCARLEKGFQEETVDLDEPWELAYWIHELNHSRAEIERAVRKVGNRAEAVRRHLRAAESASRECGARSQS